MLLAHLLACMGTISMKNAPIMKKFLHTSLTVLLVTLANIASSQTIYNITSDITVTGAKMPEQCSNCVINISEGVTLTVNKEIFLQNTTFNGGTILANKEITFWSAGQFNNTQVVVKNKSGITSSGALAIKNTTFTFEGTSKATLWSTVNMDNSKMIFNDNANLEATSTVNLKNNSLLQAGDGEAKSKAFIFFNGGTLNEYDNSRVTVANTNNYYRNWNNFNSVSNNKSYKTTFNTINCGTAGKNSCDAANVYGPATMNFAGVASFAMLPVKLSAFTVKLTGATAEITWTTDMEENSDRFEIERSLDGINWTKAATVKSKGNSTIVNHYNYNDALKLSGSVSYRLKMIDIDGSAAYSPIRTVKAECAVEMSMFPNPAVNYVMISGKDNNAKNVQLFNQSGQMLKQMSGNGNINFSVAEFKSGNYIVRVVDATGVAKSFKLIIKK